MPDESQATRLPKGSECQCRAEGCGLFFTGETAFKKHWTRAGHVHPSEVGLVERQRVAGPVWGGPSPDAPIARSAAQGGPINGSEA